MRSTELSETDFGPNQPPHEWNDERWERKQNFHSVASADVPEQNEKDNFPTHCFLRLSFAFLKYLFHVAAPTLNKIENLRQFLFLFFAQSVCIIYLYFTLVKYYCSLIYGLSYYGSVKPL